MLLVYIINNECLGCLFVQKSGWLDRDKKKYGSCMVMTMSPRPTQVAKYHKYLQCDNFLQKSVGRTTLIMLIIYCRQILYLLIFIERLVVEDKYCVLFSGCNHRIFQPYFSNSLCNWILQSWYYQKCIHCCWCCTLFIIILFFHPYCGWQIRLFLQINSRETHFGWFLNFLLLILYIGRYATNYTFSNFN